MSAEPTQPVPVEAAPSDASPSEASPRAHWKRRPRAAPIPREEAARQGAITQLAFLTLGREAAIEFLNSAHEGLGGRPLALATASAAGRDEVEAELSRMSYREADKA